MTTSKLWCDIEPLTEEHDVATFTCGNDDADAWIQTKAMDQAGRVATHLAVAEDGRIIGFFSLKTIAVVGDEMSKALKGSASSKTAFLLCWIAVHTEHQKQRCFVPLLHEAWSLAIVAAAASPVDLFVLDPLSDELGATYAKFGFNPLKPGSRRLGIKMSKVREVLAVLGAGHGG